MTLPIEPPFVFGLFICLNAGLPMNPVNEVHAVAGKGLKDDRYYKRCGTWTKNHLQPKRQVSLIAIEGIEAANALHPRNTFEPHETRRNIITKGIPLGTLLRKTFHIGAVTLRGLNFCIPCDHPSKLIGRHGFKRAFQEHGGLLCEVIESGCIKIGDRICLKPGNEQGDARVKTSRLLPSQAIGKTY